jgi:periplasmic protein TonB
MVKPAAGKLVLIAESRRDAAWVERSGRAPVLVVHSNDDLSAAMGPVAPTPDSDVRVAGKLPRDTYVARAFALSVGVHLVLAAGIFWMLPGAPTAPPLATIEMVFAKVESDVVVEAQGKPVPEQVTETQVAEARPPVPEPLPVSEPPLREPEPPLPVAEAPPVPEPPPSPPEPDPIPEIVKAPEPPPPPPPEVKVEKPAEPKVEPRPRPPRPKPVKLTEPRPVPVVVTPPAEIVREDAAPSKVDTGQSTTTPEVAAAPIVNDDKMPQEAAAPVVNTAPAISALKFRNNTKPTYPSRARDMNIEGTVLLEVWIDVEGNPTNVIVIQSSGSPLLDEAARRGAWRWTFWPYTVNGRAEPRSAHVPVPFKLNN